MLMRRMNSSPDLHVQLFPREVDGAGLGDDGGQWGGSFDGGGDEVLEERCLDGLGEGVADG